MAWMPVAACIPLLFLSSQIGIFVPFGYALGFFIDGDLDQIGISRADGKMIRSVIGIPLMAWFTFYAVLMKPFGGHRSLWSHTPFISTAIRIAWIILPVGGFCAYFTPFPWYEWTRPVIGLWLGLSLADCVHYYMDYYYKKA
jgi:hypothetical protein